MSDEFISESFVTTFSDCWFILQVNHTAIEQGAEELDDECPETDYGEETVGFSIQL